MKTILDQLKIKAKVIGHETNGTMSKYQIELLPGTKVSKIEKYATEIAIGLRSYGKPIIKVVSEKGIVLVELLINPVSIVHFTDLIQSLHLSTFKLPLVLGKTHDGNDLIIDLTTMPHILMAGTTGSGKSILLHSIINSIIENNNSKLILIDPKKVEFSYYKELKHLLYPLITEPKDAQDVLSDLVEEMENRFRLMSKNSCRHVSELERKLPYIVLIIDEFSDLINSVGSSFKKQICTLAQKSRAAGIHLILATQRASAKNINGDIKASFPARISLKVVSGIDSRIILDQSGAEKLLGKGDALINSPEHNLIRFQSAFLSGEEIIQRVYENRRKNQNFFNWIFK